MTRRIAITPPISFDQSSLKTCHVEEKDRKTRQRDAEIFEDTFVCTN